jgi:ubiquilin
MGGPPVNPEDMLRQLENPNFVQQMNEVMNNPMFVQMLENTPMFRDNPLARQMIRDPSIRRMMLDPNVIRAQLQMQQQMGGGTGPGGSSFPAPGVTDTTPQTGGTSGPESRDRTPAQNATGSPPPPFPGFGGANPFAFAGAGAGADSPFELTFGPSTNEEPPSTETSSGTTTENPTATTGGAGENPTQNPFARLFGPGFPNLAGGRGAEADMYNNPAFLQSLLAGMGAPPQTQAPADTRPPEERYAEQLRQLNDMGFYEFERNIEALRRSGGSVQGAVEYLLTHPSGS